MKIFNIIFCILFLVSAILQYNDPDPYLWMPIYLFVAILCALAAKGRFFPGLYLAGIFAYGMYAVFLLVKEDGMLDWMQQHEAENIAQSMKATHPWIENTREFFGLVIMILVLLVNYFYAKKKITTAA